MDKWIANSMLSLWSDHIPAEMLFFICSSRINNIEIVLNKDVSFQQIYPISGNFAQNYWFQTILQEISWFQEHLQEISWFQAILPQVQNYPRGATFAKIVRGCACRTKKLWLSLYHIFTQLPTYQYTDFVRKALNLAQIGCFFTGVSRGWRREHGHPVGVGQKQSNQPVWG